MASAQRADRRNNAVTRNTNGPTDSRTPQLQYPSSMAIVTVLREYKQKIHQKKTYKIFSNLSDENARGCRFSVVVTRLINVVTLR